MIPTSGHSHLDIAPASYETYRRLRDLDLSHPAVAGAWRLGHVASWARWGTTTHDLAPITAASPEEFRQLPPLTTSVVLLAINWGGNAPPVDPTFWTNFHTRGHRGDGTLKNSVRLAMSTLDTGQDQVAAPYLTDVFKLVPTPTSARLDDRIEEDLARGVDHVARCATALEHELTLCREGAGGRAPILVGMGGAATRWLRGEAADRRMADSVDRALGGGAHLGVRRMDHYTFGVGSNVSRAAVVAAALRDASTLV